jgi:hypothetical protein
MSVLNDAMHRASHHATGCRPATVETIFSEGRDRGMELWKFHFLWRAVVNVSLCVFLAVVNHGLMAFFLVR